MRTDDGDLRDGDRGGPDRPGTDRRGPDSRRTDRRETDRRGPDSRRTDSRRADPRGAELGGAGDVLGDGGWAEPATGEPRRRSGSPVTALILLVAFGLSALLCCMAAGRALGLFELDVDPAHLW